MPVKEPPHARHIYSSQPAFAGDITTVLQTSKECLPVKTEARRGYICCPRSQTWKVHLYPNSRLPTAQADLIFPTSHLPPHSLALPNYNVFSFLCLWVMLQLFELLQSISFSQDPHLGETGIKFPEIFQQTLSHMSGLFSVLWMDAFVTNITLHYKIGPTRIL